MKSILEYTDKYGTNCLIISFQPMEWYRIETKKYPTTLTGMFTEIEDTIMYLIEEGEEHGVDMQTILDTRNKAGQTLFHWATQYSEKIALALLERDVIVNTIRYDFVTPSFYVS